ncbi:hypothetical protein FHG87_019380 [Trinorchestia longiramus]|nr:hypothetical protein FHG87_019380 [Trinorchestia longiramus]
MTPYQKSENKLSLTNERSRSGSSVQITALHNGAAVLGVTHAPPSAFKVNISTTSSRQLNTSIHSQQQSKESRNQPSCLRTGWGLNNPRTNKKCTLLTHHALQLYTSQRTTGKMSVRQHHNVKTCAKKNQQLISYSNAKYKVLNSSCLQLPFLLLGSSTVPCSLRRSLRPRRSLQLKKFLRLAGHEGIVHYELLGGNQTMTCAVRSQKLCRLKTVLKEKRPLSVNRTGVILHHDNARPHTSRGTKNLI